MPSMTQTTAALGAILGSLLLAGCQSPAPDPAAFCKAGNALMDKRDLRGAAAEFDKAIKLDPTFAPAYVQLGVVNGRLGRIEAALAALDRAIALDPADPAAFFSRGAVLARTGQTEGALADYGRATALDPKLHEAWYAQAKLLDAAGQAQAAIAAYRHFLEAAPHDSEREIHTATFRIKVLEGQQKRGK